MVPSLYGNYSFIDGSYWTLLVELKFYLAVAVLILLRTYIPISLAKVALCLTIPVVYFAFYFNPYHISFIEHKSLTVLHYFGSEYAQYFIAGILFYELYKKRASIFTYVALALCYVVAVLIALDRAYDSNSPEIIFLYITSFFGIFLAISLRRITNASFTFLGTRYRKILTTLGALTYPIYLLHNVLSHAIIEALIQHHVPTYIASPLFFVTLLLLIFLVNMFDIQIRTLWKKIL
jgi:peptidoglycan/LPS O-acetylase OafA/YrhL